MKKQLFYIIFISVIACFMLYVLERVILVSYEVKTIAKILLFTLIPLLYWKYYTPVRLKKRKLSNLSLSVALSIATFGVIWLAFFFLKDLVDFQEINNQLQLSKQELVVRGIYIIVGNAFLEEFFFRGFIFLNLYRLSYRKTAYIFSSALFAIYHIAIFQSWFTLPIMLVILIALFLVGFIFNYLCQRVSSFTGSWVVHASADLAIILIGFYMFF